MGLVPKDTITVDGKEYVIALDLWAFHQYKEKTGKDLLKGETPTEIDEMIAFFWSALLREQPEITLEETGHIIHPGNIEEISDKLTALYEESQPQGEDEGKNG